MVSEWRSILQARVAIRTRNPNNGATGNSRLAGIMKAKERKAQRSRVRGELALVHREQLCDAVHVLAMGGHLRVTLTRVAPSSGLDPHDGLGAALKSACDAVADALGLTNDRDPRLEWRYAQRRGRAEEYAVEIHVEASR